ncbi:MAG: allantoinase AllB [Actinomycetota bacterium]|nr:allantoinase AllB [Actinomycetota bacterium]
MDLLIRARRAVLPSGEVAASVGVAGGRIVAIEGYDAGLVADRTVTVDDDAVLLPGLVDTHVHVNEPGRTSWEGFASATRAAAAGGVTTIVDMPLNSIPPTVDVAALEVKRAAARSQAFVDVGFWGGAIPGNLGALPALHKAGVVGFKCFLLDSGVPEFPALADLSSHLSVLSDLDAVLIVHAEDAGVIERAPAGRGPSYSAFLASRPRSAEDVAIAQVIEAARATGARVHIVHLSSADALPMIAAARRDGVRITAETCPHYLTFTAEEVPDGATQYKCCPPIREAANRDALWQGLADGVLTCVVSDHSPCTPDLKRLDTGDFAAAWGGIAGLQLGLPAVWTEARRRGHNLSDVVRWMASGPAALAGLASKGRMAVGCDADFAVFAPDASFVVDPANLHHRNKVTPYAGREMEGVVRSTWLRGEEITDEAPGGRLLTGGGLPHSAK